MTCVLFPKMDQVFSLKKEKKQLKKPEKLRNFCQSRKVGIILTQVQFQVLHRDLAARNVLVTGADILKIADFGMTRECTKLSDYYRPKVAVSIVNYHLKCSEKLK